MNKKSVLQWIRNGCVVLNKSVNIITLAVIIAAIILSVYALTDINRVIVNGSYEQYAVYKPRENKKSFEELQGINPEVLGWITVYGTSIDYPITQAENNEKYLMLGPDLEYSLLGSIFLDANNHLDFSDFNSILYGHNMTPRAMFGAIKDYKDEAYFDAHRYGDLFYNNTHHGLLIFALYEEDGYHPFLKKVDFKDDAERQAYLDTIIRMALVYRSLDIDVSKDRIVTMYTCSNASTNGRELLVALITDEVYENPFPQDNQDNRFEIFFGSLKKVPAWIWPYLLLLILLIILFIVKRIDAKKEEERRKRIAQAAQESGAEP